jgi:septum formation protein
VTFSVVVPSVEEVGAGAPDEVALENARRKASAVVASAEPGSGGSAVLGVDTVVWAGGRLYGKPAGLAAARDTLRALSGIEHEVVSAVCLIRGESERTALARTRVRFRELDDRLLDWYLETDEWRERAGGYAIQGRGAALVAAIDGDYFNVVGLPVAALLELEPGLVG